MKFIPAAYHSAIQSLEEGLTQLEPDGKNCSICGDNCHQAFECHHNPLVAMRNAEGFRCLHCGKVFFGSEAVEHFGLSESVSARCVANAEILLVTLKRAYRKHHLSDESIGWDELGNEMCDVLCEVMGDDAFQRFCESVKSAAKGI